MPSRPQLTEEELTLKELLSEFRDINRKLENVAPHVEIIANELEQIRGEIDWLINNRADILPLLLKSMPADPCARPFRINQADQVEEAETVSCAGSCDAYVDSLADAVKAGWSRLTHDPTGMSWNFLGICPCCIAEQAQEDKPPQTVPAVSQTPSRPKSGPRTLFSDQE